MRYMFQNIFCHSGCPCEKELFYMSKRYTASFILHIIILWGWIYMWICYTFTFLMQVTYMWHLIRYTGLEYFHSCFSLSSFKELKFSPQTDCFSSFTYYKCVCGPLWVFTTFHDQINPSAIECSLHCILTFTIVEYLRFHFLTFHFLNHCFKQKY